MMLSSPNKKFPKQTNDESLDASYQFYQNKGVKEFLARQNKIKKNKEEKEKLNTRFDGSGWNGKLTKPKGFKFYNPTT